MPSGRLQDGWLIRWRVRGVTSTGVIGSWSEWQTAKVDVSKPSVSDLYARPGTRGTDLWTFSSLTPLFQARVSDPDGRSATLGIEVEHDPQATNQGSGLIWAKTGTAFQPNAYLSELTMPAGLLQDGWSIRWRVRGVTSDGVIGPWSSWQNSKVDVSKPAVSDLTAEPGTFGSGLWSFSSLTPLFQARVIDPDDRSGTISIEVEHDPSAAGQGAGLIWSKTGTAFQPNAYLSELTMPSGKLQDGWLVRWRVRGVTSDGVNGPWSEWQAGKVDVSKPAVSDLTAEPGTFGSGLWSFSSLTPLFQARVIDPDDRSGTISIEVEHDPSAAGQGAGLIWSKTGTAFQPNAYLSELTMPSGKLQDGWLVRWRVRGVTSDGVNGPWSEWQAGKVEANKPAGTAPGLMPGTKGVNLWSSSSLTPWLYAKVTDAGGASSYLGVEVEHDPTATTQGTGLIWGGKGTTAYTSGSNAWAQIPAGKLSDGWLIRWRVRGVTTTGTAGPWSDWFSTKVDITKPAVAAAGLTPGTQGSGLWTTNTVTPWVYGKVSDPQGRASFLKVEVEHDPDAANQGTGPIWAGTGTTSYASDTNAWVQIPTAKLQDGWLVRWRIQGVTTTGVAGPWSDWQKAQVDLKKPSVEGLGMDPAVRGAASWTATSLTPWLYAKVTDPDNRASYLSIEVAHDPADSEHGTGMIYSGTATTSYPSGSNAWMGVPENKLTDGWMIQWRVQAVTTSGVKGPWSGWQYAVVSALPFKTFHPDNNMQVGTLTPTLSANAVATNGATVTYWFQVCAGTKPNWTWCEDSKDWTKSGSWTVPEGKLKWGETYSWFAKAATSTTTVTSSWRVFTPSPEQGTLGSLLATGVNGHEFDPTAGNYTTSATDAAVATVGPPLTVTRTYNSLDPRTDGAFGAGWTTRWDMRITEEKQTSTLLVTYPDGQQLRFASKGDGTYASPEGTYATLATISGGGWRLMDKEATSYWFDASGRLTKITDQRGRGQDLTYGTDGKLAKVVTPGGRSLNFVWTGAHVTSVSTDPVGGTPQTWTYSYDGDKLVKACPPATTTACTTYAYGDASRYRSIVLDSGPSNYWRLDETATATGTKIASSSTPTAEQDGDAKLTGSTADIVAAVPGALTGSPDTAMRFKGTATSTYVSLPRASISGLGSDLAVEAWFKTTGSGTIIGYQNSSDSTPSAFTPVIYVGTDGKLRGQFYTGTPAPITSATAVNNGAWHHVVLSGAEDTQTLFLDGQVVGTLAGKIQHFDQWETRIGSGFGSSAWPASKSSTAAFPFAGDIDEVAVYGKPLGLALVNAHYAARLLQPQLTKVVQPSGRVWAENAYAPDGGRLTTNTDANGGVWKLSAPVFTKESTISTSATITVTDPNGGTLTYVSDALRGYRPVSQTDQLGKSVKFAYDVGGFPAKVYDANGNVVEVAFDARGNLLSKRTCRSPGSCSTEYFEYYLNVDNPFDPRNDQKTKHRDARSVSPVDDTYLTTWSYNNFGEEVEQSIPATSDFPTGRTSEKTYTDGTELAVGGGLTPAGLVKSAKDVKGNETVYAYNAAGDLVAETSPMGLVKKYGHNEIGRVTTQTEVSKAYPDGVTTTFAYDAAGRVAAKTGFAIKNDVTGATHTWKWTATYDTDGRTLSETTADLTGGDATRSTTYTYDAFGRVESVTGPEGGVQRFAYNTMGQKVEFTDERGAVFAYAYTPREELATTTLKGWTGSPAAPQAATDVVVASYAYDPGGRLASQTDAMGRTTAYTYYADNLLADTIARGAKLNGSVAPRDVLLDSKIYDAAGNLTRQTTANGTLRVDAVYDAANRVRSLTADPAKLNKVTTYAYDANDNVTKISQTGAGSDRTEVVEFAYNADDRPVRQALHNDGQDLITTLTVDERGLTTAVTDPRGNAPDADPAAFTTNLTYNAAGLTTQVQLPPVTVEHAGALPSTQRPITTLGYNTFGEQTHQVDAESRVTSATLDRAGHVTEQIFPAYTPPGGQPITPKATARYNAAGDLISATDRRGQITTALYDGLGRKVQVTMPKGGVWTYGYDLLGEALWTTDAAGGRSESTYDDLGRQITLTTVERKPTQAAYVTKLEYDDAGRVTKTTRPTGDASTRSYDATGTLTAQTDALGNTTTFAYDVAGRPVKTTNPLGVSSTASYDLAGRKIRSQDLDTSGSVLRARTFGYDLAGNPISLTSAEGHTVTQTFDAANRMIEHQEPVSATEKITTSFGYDATGAQTRSTDGRGNATFTTYNSLGMAESVIEPSTAAHPNLADRTWTTSYDAGGNPVSRLAPGGVRVDRTFDELNRMVKQTGTGAEVATEDKTFGYDQVGRLTNANDLTFTLNDRGLLLKTSGPGGDINAYAYDANKRLVQRVDATGNSAFTWDDADRLTQSVDPVSATTIDYTYDKASRLTNMAYGASGARRVYIYDALNRLTKDQLTTSSASPIASIEYGYDLDDNMTSKTTAGTAGAGANTYAYDWSNRLTSWTAPDGKKTAYEWDASGNRTKAGAKTYTYDERNRLTSGDGHTYTYTARGTLSEDSSGIVHISKFDAFDRLINDDAVTYDYDALDRVETRVQGTQTMHHAYDGLTNNLVCVSDANGVKRGLFGRDALGRTLGISDGGGAQLAYSDLHGDLVGTFKADGSTLLDSASYDPFGEVTARAGDAHLLGYQGAYTDLDTGKVNMAARWYQPTTGSFVSRDTLTQSPDPSVQLNRYTYANDNPLTNIDPSGHDSLSKIASKLVNKVIHLAISIVGHALGGASMGAALAGASAKGKTCPKGAKTSKDPICKDAAGEYKDCAKENKGQSGKAICQGMKTDYIGCRTENRGGNFKTNHKICDAFADQYVWCRKGGEYWPGHSHDVCVGASQEVRRCQFGDLNGGRKGYGQGAGGVCDNVRFDYYSCRSDKRGDDPGCSSFAETQFRCRLHENVKCNDMQDKFLSCYRRGRGMSANECAFGVNALAHCRDSAQRGLFSDKGTCGATWNSFMKRCDGLRGLKGNNCTQGENWQDVTFSICEKEGKCVTYVSDEDKGALSKGDDMFVTVFGSALDVCAAVLGIGEPHFAAGCGVAKAALDVITAAIKKIDDDTMSAAMAQSKFHGEGAGIAVITWKERCTGYKGLPCWQNKTDYGPL